MNLLPTVPERLTPEQLKVIKRWASRKLEDFAFLYDSLESNDKEMMKEYFRATIELAKKRLEDHILRVNR